MRPLQPAPPSLEEPGGWGAQGTQAGGGPRTRSEAGLGEGPGTFSLWGPSQLMTRSSDRKGLV